MRLRDKAIIVTGSTTGIGEAIARRFVAEGARVLVHGVEPDLGAAVVASLGPAAVLHLDDLADPAAPRRIVDRALQAFGSIDAVVNNAAWVPRDTISDVTVERFERTMAINARAPMLMIQAAFEALKQARGSVLNVGSINCYSGEPNFVTYAMSKGALTTLTRNLGDSLHREVGIRVNQINPDWVLTPNELKNQKGLGMPDDWHTRLPAMWAPSGGLIPAETIAAAAVFWIGDESRPISGSVVDLGQFPFIGRNPPKKL